MTDDFKIGLSIGGSDHEFTKEGARELIVRLLHVLSELTPQPGRMLKLDDAPVPINGFLITAIDGNPEGARISIGVGPVDLQFETVLPVLHSAFQALKEQTETNATSFPRLN